MTILANAEDHPDDEIAAIFAGFAPLRQPDRGLEPLLDTAPSGLALAFQGYTPWDEFTSIPNDQATQVEQRSFSSLFDVDAATWESVVVPVIEALRAMPRPDQPYRGETVTPWSCGTSRTTCNPMSSEPPTDVTVTTGS